MKNTKILSTLIITGFILSGCIESKQDDKAAPPKDVDSENFSLEWSVTPESSALTPAPLQAISVSLSVKKGIEKVELFRGAECSEERSLGEYALEANASSTETLNHEISSAGVYQFSALLTHKNGKSKCVGPYKHYVAIDENSFYMNAWFLEGSPTSSTSVTLEVSRPDQDSGLQFEVFTNEACTGEPIALISEFNSSIGEYSQQVAVTLPENQSQGFYAHATRSADEAIKSSCREVARIAHFSSFGEAPLGQLTVSDPTTFPAYNLSPTFQISNLDLRYANFYLDVYSGDSCSGDYVGGTNVDTSGQAQITPWSDIREGVQKFSFMIYNPFTWESGPCTASAESYDFRAPVKIVATNMATSRSQQISGQGGVPPYQYSIVSGGGSLDSSTGLFAAPIAAQSVTLQISDSLGMSDEKTILILQPFNQIEVVDGYAHVCAIGDGALYCWGDNWRYQLTDRVSTSSSSNKTRPVKIFNSGVSSVAPGFASTCAVVDGSVKCWGWKGTGNNWNGDDSTHQKTPLDVFTEPNPRQVVIAGNENACVRYDSAIKCRAPWSSTTLRTVNVNLTGASLVDITTDYSYLYVRVDNNVYRYSPSNPTTATVSSLSVFESVKNGSPASGGCQKSGSSVACSGWNLWGQVGDGSFIDRPAENPFTVFDSGVTQLAATSGGASYCALFGSEGRVECWGYGWYNQLGNGSDQNQSSPVLNYASGVEKIHRIAGGNSGFHYCATVNGLIECWGHLVNSSFQGKELIRFDQPQ